jgi:hypothetical protein
MPGRFAPQTGLANVVPAGRESKSKKAKGKRGRRTADEGKITLRAERVHTFAFLLLPFDFF